MSNQRHLFQLKLLKTINNLSLCGKWNELSIALKYLNSIITRHYIDSYWKYLFQVVYQNLPNSIETIPQFIDCLKAMNIRKQNEVVYSFVYLLMSKNLFDMGVDLLQMYHLTAKYESEEDINTLVSLLNADFQYIKWKKSLADKGDGLQEQLAEKCSFQLQLIINKSDIADSQIKKQAEIYMYYDRVQDVEDLLEKYSLSHISYINAQKYLFEFQIEHNSIYLFDVFNRIAKLSPSDSFVLKYCKKFSDLMMSIDCLFDMLDYFQWKYDDECWNCLSELLITADEIHSIKECINENWMIRKNYWIQYHFSHLNFNKKFKKVNLLKLNVAILLLGKENKFVEEIVKFYSLSIISYQHLIDKRNWLARNV